MYASGEEPQIGDLVKGSGGEGKVLKVIPNGIGGENVLVQWTTPKTTPGGYKQLQAPVQVPTQSLTFVRHG